VKITRAFTLSLEIVQELKKQKNQSKFVEDAVREKLKLEMIILQKQYVCIPCDTIYTPRNVNSARDSMTCRKCGSTIYASTGQ